MSKAIKKNDNVVVISGEHRGRSGRVLHVDRRKQRVTIEGVNVGRKTLRRSAAQPQGGMVDRERPIHISNVMLEERWEQRHGQADEGNEE